MGRFIALFKGISALAVAMMTHKLSITFQILTWVIIDIALWQLVNLYMVVTNLFFHRD
jgi:hypothetical protein